MLECGGGSGRRYISQGPEEGRGKEPWALEGLLGRAADIGGWVGGREGYGEPETGSGDGNVTKLRAHNIFWAEVGGVEGLK